MPVVQTFEETLDTDERLAALAAAMNRLPAEAVVRRLTAADADILRVDRAHVDPARVDQTDHPAPEPHAPATTPLPLGTVRPATECAPRQALDAAAPAAGATPALLPASVPISLSIPVPEPLVGLLPGGLRRGEAATLATKNQGPDFLALALLAEALKAGLWCAVIGVPELGLAALAGLLGPAAQRQAALDRLILVAEPGEQWAEITATLADGVDLLLARPVTPVRAETAQRVDARLRQGRSAGTRHSAALLVLGGWPTARLALRVARMDWTGLDGIGATAGTGHLTAGRATVVAQGRATAGRPRAARLWLPDATGAVRSLSSDNPRIVNQPTTIPSRPSQAGLDAPAVMEPAIAAPSLTLIPAAMPPAPGPASASPTSSASPDSPSPVRSPSPTSPVSPAA